MTDDAPDDIDALMAQDPLGLSRQDLDRIIAYQRKQRAMREQGVRTKKPKGERPAEATIEQLLSSMPKPVQVGPTIKRRV